MAVAAQAVKPASKPQRFVRLCPQHHLPLEESLLSDKTGNGHAEVLSCQEGHEVKRWATYDRARGLVYGFGTADVATVVDGELGEALAKLSAVCKLVRAPQRVRKRDLARVRGLTPSPLHLDLRVLGWMQPRQGEGR